MSEVNRGIAANQLATSVAAIQRFFVQELCDVYIEFSKPVLYGNRLEENVDVDEQHARKRSACHVAPVSRLLDASAASVYSVCHGRAVAAYPRC